MKQDMDEEDLEPHMQELRLGGSYVIWHAQSQRGEKQKVPHHSQEKQTLQRNRWMWVAEVLSDKSVSELEHAVVPRSSSQAARFASGHD